MGPGSAGRPDWRHAKSPLQKRGPAPQKTPRRRAERRHAGPKAPRATGWLALHGAPSPSLFMRGKKPAPAKAGSDSPEPPVGSGRRPAPGIGEQPSGAMRAARTMEAACMKFATRDEHPREAEPSRDPAHQRGRRADDSALRGPCDRRIGRMAGDHQTEASLLRLGRRGRAGQRGADQHRQSQCQRRQPRHQMLVHRHTPARPRQARLLLRLRAGWRSPRDLMEPGSPPLNVIQCDASLPRAAALYLRAEQSSVRRVDASLLKPALPPPCRLP